MSETDSFIDEVTEEVRRDRLFALMRRYGWIAVVLVLLVVGGAAWKEYSQVRAEAEAQAFGDAILAALEPEDASERAAALGKLTAPGPGAAAVLDLLEASELVKAGDASAAAARLDAVAASGDVPEIYREIAAYKSLSRPDSGLSADERRLRLEAMAVPGKPLRLLAEEQLALLEIEEGRSSDAIDRLKRIREDSEVTAGLRQRASQLIVALGGAPEAG